MDNILNKRIKIKSKRIAPYKKTDCSGYLFLPSRTKSFSRKSLCNDDCDIAASISQNYGDANVHLLSQVG